MFYIKMDRKIQKKGSYLLISLWWIQQKIITKIKKMAQTKVTSLDKSGSASKNVTEKTEKLDGKKISVPSLDKSESASKTETERTEKHDSKKISVQLSSSNDKNLA